MTDNWMPEELRDLPYFRAAEDGTQRTIDEVKADIINAAQMQGDINSYIRAPDKSDAEAVSTAAIKALDLIPGITIIPSGDDTEAQAAFYRSIGVPESVDKYVSPADIPEGIDINAIKELGIKSNWTQDQFKRYADAAIVERKAQADKQVADIDKNRADIKSLWGSAYDEMVQSVGQFLDKTDGVPQGIIDAFKSDQLKPDEVKWIHSMAKAIASEDMQLSSQVSGSSALTPSEAMEQLPAVEKVLYAMKRSDPNYQVMIAKQERLLRASAAGSTH